MRYVLLAALLLLAPAAPSTAQILGPALPPVEWEQRPGAELPLGARFVDQDNRSLALAECFGERPVVLALVYYECPMLCGLVFEGLVRSLRALDFAPGKEFDVVALSIDPGETSALAAAKRASCLESYGIDAADPRAAGWRFLTGEEAAIRAVAGAVGFGYSYLPESDQWAHPAGVTVLTSGGRVSRVLYGVDFAPRDLRFALIEAAEGKIGSPVDQVLLRCFDYDPARGKYGFAILTVVRFLGLLTLGVLAFFVLRWTRRERRALASAVER